MKILLAGGYDTKNLGDHGSLEVFQRELRKVNPSTEIVLLSRHPDEKFDNKYKVRSILNLDHKNKKESLGRWFNGFNEGDQTDHLNKIRMELENTDLLVIGNGRLFVDLSLGFMKGPLPYFVLLITLAKLYNIPVMIFSMTIVPIKSKYGIEMLNYILSNSSVITVREESSRDEVLNYGICKSKIKVIPDAAFGLNKIVTNNKINVVLKNEKINPNKRYVGVNYRFTHLSTHIDDNYYEKLATLTDILIDKLDTNILMVPQMTYNIDNPLDDDRVVYEKVYKFVKNKKRCHIIRGEYDIFDTLELYQYCDMLFSMRRHGLIFAATQGTAIFALSGEKNTAYVMNSLNVNEYQNSVDDILIGKNIEKAIECYLIRKNIKEKMMKRVIRYNNQISEYALIALSYKKNINK